MSSVDSQIRELEEQLRKAELGPDPKVFETLLDDNMVMAFDGDITCPKNFIVAAHFPGKAQKFHAVEIRDMKVTAHGDTLAVVNCTGDFEGEKGRFVFKFMRVWAKKLDGWRIIAGAMFPIEQENVPSKENFDQAFAKS